MQGATGWSYGRGHAKIWVNISVNGWEMALARSVVHEFNHSVRAQRTKRMFKEHTLLDTIASEGLAQCFEETVCGRKPPYATAITLKQARQVWKSVKPELNRSDEKIYRSLFFGDEEFPHWSGYTLSYLIVSKRIRESEMDWSTLMALESAKIVGSGLD
jgi:uncharacterized protein YjaZ